MTAQYSQLEEHHRLNIIPGIMEYRWLGFSKNQRTIYGHLNFQKPEETLVQELKRKTCELFIVKFDILTKIIETVAAIPLGHYHFAIAFCQNRSYIGIMTYAKQDSPHKANFYLYNIESKFYDTYFVKLQFDSFLEFTNMVGVCKDEWYVAIKENIYKLVLDYTNREGTFQHLITQAGDIKGRRILTCFNKTLIFKSPSRTTVYNLTNSQLLNIDVNADNFLQNVGGSELLTYTYNYSREEVEVKIFGKTTAIPFVNIGEPVANFRTIATSNRPSYHEMVVCNDILVFFLQILGKQYQSVYVWRRNVLPLVDMCLKNVMNSFRQKKIHLTNDNVPLLIPLPINLQKRHLN